MCDCNKKIIVKVKRLPHADGLPLPQRMSSGASGFDLCAAVIGNIRIVCNYIVKIPTGFCFEIPVGYEMVIRPRSGLSTKYGIIIPNSPATIDSDYRGEVFVSLISLLHHYIVSPGERIAQGIIQIVPEIEMVEVDELRETVRGSGGFGSTGK